MVFRNLFGKSKARQPHPRMATAKDGLRRIAYTCPCCGKQQTGLPAIAFDAPYPYFIASEEDRERHFRIDSNRCVMDEEHYFVRCVLAVPIVGTDDTMEWGVWSSLSEANFETYGAYFHIDPPDDLPPFFGWLSNALPGYPDTINLKCKVHLLGDDQRPAIELEPTDHPLSVDQREGITAERALELAEPLLKTMAH